MSSLPAAGWRRFLSSFCFCCSPGGSTRGGRDGAQQMAGEDLISRLPDDVLSSIVALLPVKEAGRTAVLSSRWRRLWASNPLVLDDIHMLLDSKFTHVAAVAATVGRVLRAHPGPFRSVSLTCFFRNADQRTLEQWVRALAAKRVQELVLNNIPWAGLDVLPCAILGGRSMLSLHISGWRFPDTADYLLQGAAPAFPLLRELVLTRSVIQEQDLERVLGTSPKLKILVFVLSPGVPAKIHLSSRSLCCVLFWHSVADELAVVAVPLLERLVLQTSAFTRVDSDSDDDGGDRMRIKISSASVLQALGYLNPSRHELQIGDSVIKVGKKAVPDAVVPSVKILALSIRFGVYDEEGIVPCFLHCFPNIETLHVLSILDYGLTDKSGDYSESWSRIDSVKCVKESIKILVIHGFRWENSEIEFLRSILRGKELQKIYILQSTNISLSEGEINGKLDLLASMNKDDAVMIFIGEEGIWTYEMASDISRSDPFDCLMS